jgi:hypothetical protein
MERPTTDPDLNLTGPILDSSATGLKLPPRLMVASLDIYDRFALTSLPYLEKPFLAVT